MKKKKAGEIISDRPVYSEQSEDAIFNILQTLIIQ